MLGVGLTTAALNQEISCRRLNISYTEYGLLSNFIKYSKVIPKKNIHEMWGCKIVIVLIIILELFIVLDKVCMCF
jgi:hypothetical protein